MKSTVEVGTATNRDIVSFKKVAPLIPLLAIGITSCVGQTPAVIENPTNINSSPGSTKPTETPSNPGDATPTAEVTRNFPSPFAGLYFGTYKESGQPTIVSAVSGVTFEKQNPGCTVPTINGSHESQLNVLYNPSVPDMAAGFMVDNNYLMSYFKARDDKSGHVLGSLPNGTPVELIDNVWKIQQNNQDLFFNPVVPNQAGRPFGYPLICEKNGQLMMAVVDNNGAIIDNTLQPAFQNASQIAKETGYTGTNSPTSVGLRPDGRMEVRDSKNSSLAYLRFLGGETKIFPSLPEGIGNLTVRNYETDKDEVLSPIFDESMSTWVWKNEKGEVRRFFDLETGHVFAQTEAINNRLIYQVDKDFGWEADLTELLKLGNDQIGLRYLTMINDVYPGVVNKLNGNTKTIFKIVHGSYDDIADKSKVSSIKDRGNSGTEMSFFWPVYDKKNNTYTLTTYLVYDFTRVREAIQVYSGYMLNSCPTTKPYEFTIGTIGGGLLLKKPI